ncbi:hypothetical protein cypCar_00044209 [Cyprinus carpio]|nr:hypothetical protein cypCar_00044209 [Cyprinus carpio]
MKCDNAFDYWGKGTMVTVSSAQPSPPKSIFAMSQCTPDSTGFFTIGCMARGFSPADSLTFKWTDYAKKELSDVVQYPAFGSGEEYTKVSHVRISKSNWDPKNPYTCKASNSEGTSLEVKIAKAEAKAKAPDGEKPTVFIYRPDNINTDRVSHVCEVTSPKLGNVSVMWKVGNEPYIKGTTSAPIRQNDSTSVLSILTMTKQEYEKLSTSITCAVRYGNMKDTNAPLQVSTSKSKQPELSCEPTEPETGFALDCNKDVLEEDEFRSLWSTATSFIFLFLFSLTYSAVLSFFKVKQ